MNKLIVFSLVTAMALFAGNALADCNAELQDSAAKPMDQGAVLAPDNFFYGLTDADPAARHDAASAHLREDWAGPEAKNVMAAANFFGYDRTDIHHEAEAVPKRPVRLDFAAQAGGPQPADQLSEANFFYGHQRLDANPCTHC